MAQNGQGIDPAVLDDIINRLLEFRQARSVRQVQVQLSEAEIRQLCTVSREIFLQQPNLLELEAPIKICVELSQCLLQHNIGLYYRTRFLSKLGASRILGWSSHGTYWWASFLWRVSIRFYLALGRSSLQGLAPR